MLSRLLGIVYILLKKGTVTAGELAEQFEVSVRTIYRDVEQLSMAGIPVYARKGKNGGISLTERFVLDKMVISEDEQKRILAALESVRETGAREEGLILQKLSAFFRADSPNWVSIDFSDWSGRRQELYEKIRQAILERRVMEFDYYSQYGEMSRRTAEPVQLVFKEYTWYVRAYCRKRQAMRLFKVLRMKRVQLLEERFEAGRAVWEETGQPDCTAIAAEEPGRCMPGEKCRQKESAESQRETAEHRQESEECPGESMERRQQEANDRRGNVRDEKVIFRVDKKEAYRIYDRFEEEEITLLPDGDFLIKLLCPLDDWTYGLILSFGPSARVIEPDYVKEKMVEKIREMEKNYL